MNDPGLDQPIADADHETHDALADPFESSNKNKEDEEADEADDNWWYASTAFPLIAGTFGPMANAFSLCALVQNWRTNIPPGGTEEHGIAIKDPVWLIAVNAVSLVCALIGNLSLLLNMARRVRFEIAQPCTILGFWIASVLLIILISIASHDFHASGVENQALTQAYYYAIFAAGLYQIISYLMCITVWGAYKGAYSKQFHLTVAQRTLMLQTISFLVYQLVGALVYSKIEGWEFLDAVYWSDFTLLTVGIGGYVPATHLGRGLLFPFAIGGIITLGLVVGSIRSLVLERGEQRMSAQMMEKMRQKVVDRLAETNPDNKKVKSTLSGLKSSQREALAKEPIDNRMEEMRRRKAEFEAMRYVQDVAARKKRYISLLVSGLAFATVWTIGAVVFWVAERNQQWTYFQSLYFAYTSLLTIGYGDFIPMSNSGKPFFVFWSLLAVPTLTILISSLGDSVVKWVKDATIFLGEISILPNDDASAWQRLKNVTYKATVGKNKTSDEGEDASTTRDDLDEDWNDVRELHPGLVKMFNPTEQRKVRAKDVRALARLAHDFEEIEGAEELSARERNDKRAAAEHRYRRMLISHLRDLYVDVKSPASHKYSYLEWCFYLRLMGEDETDSSKHLRAPVDRHQTKTEDHPSIGRAENKWSWLGENSPLMAGQDESEWLMERLFARLEESLHGEWHGFERLVNQAEDSDPLQETSSISDQTLSNDMKQRKKS